MLKEMIGDRLAESRRRKGLAQVELAVAMGDRYDQTVISAVEHNRSALRFDGLCNAAKELEVSLDYLFGLTDDPTPAAELSAKVSDLTDPEALAGPKIPAKILEFPASLTPDVLPVPLREEVRAAAESGAIIDNEAIMGYLPFRRDWLAKHGLKPKQCSVIEVFGHSMEPTLQNGAMILVDHQRVRRLQNRIFVLWADDGVIVKRLAHDNHHWQLLSDNAHYKPLPWPEEATVIGQVMWTGRTL